jgi:membrane associated rhomboid family serine protease
VVGGVVGFLAGAVLGGVIGCAANRDSYGVFCGGQDDTKVFVGAALGGVAGGAVGALLFRRERWTVIAGPWGAARE